MSYRHNFLVYSYLSKEIRFDVSGDSHEISIHIFSEKQ